MSTQGGQFAIRTPTHRNVASHRMTAPLPASSPSSVLPPSSRCALIQQGEIGGAFERMLLFQIFKLF